MSDSFINVAINWQILKLFEINFKINRSQRAEAAKYNIFEMHTDLKKARS